MVYCAGLDAPGFACYILRIGYRTGVVEAAAVAGELAASVVVGSSPWNCKVEVAACNLVFEEDRRRQVDTALVAVVVAGHTDLVPDRGH